MTRIKIFKWAIRIHGDSPAALAYDELPELPHAVCVQRGAVHHCFPLTHTSEYSGVGLVVNLESDRGV